MKTKYSYEEIRGINELIRTATVLLQDKMDIDENGEGYNHYRTVVTNDELYYSNCEMNGEVPKFPRSIDLYTDLFVYRNANGEGNGEWEDVYETFFMKSTFQKLQELQTIN